MAADFILAMKKHIEEDESITEAKLVMAREAAAYARSIAPVAPVDGGDYRDGIQVQHVGVSGVAVAFTDYKSVWIEYGTVDTPEFAVAARTVEHFRDQ
ncbi:uncharacterized protein RMCC_2430 [Mycolicibacterium canariasense]|uniref:Uncharacterized protein n=1 Tax=Mycolicibacterium canariasense TaxID=228230 RepID=A0A117I9W5_MYCCR|nr:HK97 gp10 family phage protein [Mycolicibacterium canariasense]MCV7212663.1 HK97 gp10 family phage protein [Mycolicibacterium canariasense]ORV02502.1 hypothetical protein AWB94_00755 [Mycolicibacterium canariasense]GAS95464.1 uncharacterized protein RMCC_2430 [Mycolicibacterium canariasense]